MRMRIFLTIRNFPFSECLVPLVDNKLKNLGADQDLDKAASDLYGLNKNNFLKFVLIPRLKYQGEYYTMGFFVRQVS